MKLAFVLSFLATTSAFTTMPLQQRVRCRLGFGAFAYTSFSIIIILAKNNMDSFS